MSDTYRVEIELDHHCRAELESEAERLGLDVSEIMSRAVAAWLGDICEDGVTTRQISVTALD